MLVELKYIKLGKLFLKLFISSSFSEYNYRPSESTSFNYWKGDKNAHFIIEEYCSSKPLMVDGKTYDPTMRMFFIQRYDKGKIYTTVLPGFWKTPPKALSEFGSLIEKHKTVLTAENGKAGRRGLTIGKKDMRGIRKALNEALPKIYKKMLKE